MRPTLLEVILISYVAWMIFKYYLNNFKKIKTKEEFEKRRDLYFSKNKWSKVINLSLQIFDEFQLNEEEEIKNLLILANCYYELRNFVSSVEYFKRAFNILFTTQKEYCCSDSFVIALKSLILLNRPNEAIELYQQIIEGKENNKDFKKLIRFAQKNNLT